MWFRLAKSGSRAGVVGGVANALVVSFVEIVTPDVSTPQAQTLRIGRRPPRRHLSARRLRELVEHILQRRAEIRVGREHDADVIPTLNRAGDEVDCDLDIDSLFTRWLIGEVLEGSCEDNRSVAFPSGTLTHVSGVRPRVLERVRLTAVDPYLHQLALEARRRATADEFTELDWIDLANFGCTSASIGMERSQRAPVEILPVDKEDDAVCHIRR